MNYFFKKTVCDGFTLVEMLIAVSLLLMVIVGPMTMAQKGIQNAYYANEQLTAVFLAQEAMEGIRALRDKNALNVYSGNGNDTEDWLDSLNNRCTDGSGQCAYDPTDRNLERCRNGQNNNCILRLNAQDGYDYVMTSGTDSIYTRKVYMRDLGTIRGTHVTVEVTWNAKLFNNTVKSVILETRIFDHYQQLE